MIRILSSFPNTYSASKICLLIFFLSQQLKSECQNSFGIKWDKTIGGNGGDRAKKILSTTSGDIITLGTTDSRNGDVATLYGSDDIILTRLSKDGVKKWSRNFGLLNHQSTALSFSQTSDGGFILVGSREHDYQTGKGLWLLKVDSLGILQWNKFMLGNFFVASVKQTVDQNYFLIKSDTNLSVMKLDVSGSILWTKVFGGSGNEIVNDMQLTPDGGFLVAGHTSSYDGHFINSHGTPASGSADALVAKFDASGDIQWTKSFGGSREEVFMKIVQDTDGNLFFSGYASSLDGDVVGYHPYPMGADSIFYAQSDAWIVKTDPSGNLLWQKCIGGSRLDYAHSIVITNDHTLAICGAVSSKNGDFSSNLYNHKTWVATLNKNNGNLLTQAFLGGDDLNEMDMAQSIDGDLFVLATATEPNPYVSKFIRNNDIWLIKLGAFNTIKGSVYIDQNANNLKDQGELSYSDAKIIINKTTDNSFSKKIEATNGIFYHNVDTGNYITSIAGNFPYYAITPVSRTISFNSYYNTDSIDFALQPLPNKKDLKIDLIPLGPARPGFDVQYKILYKNAGTTVINNPSINFVKNPKLNVISTVPAYTSITGDTVVWNYSELNPQDTGSIILNLRVVTPPAANNGDTLRSYAVIHPVTGDLTPNDDTSRLKQIVVGSYDPNDKTEANAGFITPAQVSSGEYLNYLIRFQNTGTDTAFNVIVRDTLDLKLDWSSFQMISSSHAYQLTINDNDKLNWQFAGIKLPDSNINEPLSHGYIAYRIKPVNTAVVGDVIHNTAGIYFDFNLPVATNMHTTTVFLAVSMPVTITSLDAISQPGNQVLLQWRTAGERNVEFYEVQKSVDGINFIILGSVSSKPGSTNTYSYIDTSPYQGVTYYRLKSVDIDKKSGLSKVVSVSHSTNTSFSFSLYPNPTSGQFVIKFSQPAGEVRIRINDVRGKIIYEKKISGIGANNLLIPINFPSLDSGVYFIQVNTVGRVFMQKLVIQ
jgi:uncharacterized repeat protein (TIGR01451 family)